MVIVLVVLQFMVSDSTFGSCIFKVEVITSNTFYSHHYDFVNNYCMSVSQVTTYIYVPFVGMTIPYSCLITGCVTRVTRRVPLVEQELLIHPKHMCFVEFVFSVQRFVSLCFSFYPFYLRFTSSHYLLITSNFSYPQYCCI